MKDIVIHSGRVKKELIFFLICFMIAFLTNVAAIIIYKTPWLEVFTQIGYVVVLSVSLYLFLAFFRLIIKLLRSVIGRLRSKEDRNNH